MSGTDASAVPPVAEMSARKVLLKAALWLEKHRKCRGAFAKNKQGQIRSPDEPDVVACCAAGALRIVAPREWRAAKHLLMSNVGCDSLYRWSDRSGKRTVIAAMRRAARRSPRG